METKQSMNKQRVYQLIDAYGANPEHWPAEERAAAQDLLSTSSELQDVQRSAAELDNYFELDRQYSDISQHQAEMLARQVTGKIASDSVKPSFVNVLIGYLIQPRYTIAFSTLLFVAIAVSIYPTSEPEYYDYSQNAFDDWMIEEVTGVTVANDSPTEFGFMELVELEQVETDSSI